MKKIILLFSLSLLMIAPAFATNATLEQNDFHIIPEASDSGGSGAAKIVSAVADTTDGKNVLDNYEKEYQKIKGDVGMQMKTGVMGRSTILDYIVYLVRFLSQVGILIGGVMIIYAGYLYGSNIFAGKAGDGKKAIKNAIIGILIIIFSYVIIKTLTSMFLE